jgi:hypothetical protein
MGYASRDLNQRPGMSAGKIFGLACGQVIDYCYTTSFLWPGPGLGKVGLEPYEYEACTASPVMTNFFDMEKGP